MMNNPTIEINIADILKEIQNDQKAMLKEMQSGQKEIQKEISDLKVNLETLKGDINVLKEETNNIKENVKGLKESQQKLITDVADLKGIKSLIVPAIVAVLASIVTVTLKTFLIN